MDGRILVTGADGFIGSHLVQRLGREGCEVRALALYNSFGSRGWLDTVPDEDLARVEVVLGDVRDPGSMRAAIEGCDVVMHLAALIAIPYSYLAPQSYVDTNVKGTVNVLEACRDSAVRRVIVTSTSEVYGTALTVPIGEDHPLQAQSPYAATKIAADQLALSFYRSFGTPVVVLRPFNTYGPRQSLRAVIPTVIGQILAGETSIRLGATAPTRDFNFVEDTVEAFLRVADCDAAVGEVVNTGSGREISVGNLVEKIAGIIGREVRVESESARMRPERSEVQRLLADVAHLEKLTGWRPDRTLDDGLRRTVEWFSRPQNLAHYRRVTEYNV